MWLACVYDIELDWDMWAQLWKLLMHRTKGWNVGLNDWDKSICVCFDTRQDRMTSLIDTWRKRKKKRKKKEGSTRVEENRKALVADHPQHRWFWSIGAYGHIGNHGLKKIIRRVGDIDLFKLLPNAQCIVKLLGSSQRGEVPRVATV